MRQNRSAIRRFLCLALGIVLCVMSLPACAEIGNDRFFAGAALTYYEGLLDAGFPEDYAEELTELHLLYPTWKFVPLDISSTNATFTWDKVIYYEAKDPDAPNRNLISESYAAYAHPTNTTLYDAGYYQASAEAVSYFMDPRNFFNENDIFQFFDLSYDESVTQAAVESVLCGSFMQDTVLENGKTYAENFMEIGKTVGIHPVYLAVKARQEQGMHGRSPVISGTCGDALLYFWDNQKTETDDGAKVGLPSSVDRAELLSLNGYYNLLNVNASGTGVFTIYRRAMERAKEGTESMRDAWGGDASWNTVWKSIYGGALLLKSSYIDRYQSTVYLQKFNVDGRSGRNFWGQYMQNVAASMTEGRTLYNSFASIDALDSPCTFLIPVYRGMPEEPCDDPANGTYSYFRTAKKKYEYSVSFTSPAEGYYANVPFYATCDAEDVLSLCATVTHEYGVKRLEYSIDGSEWSGVLTNGGLNLPVSMQSRGDGEHILVVRGIADYEKDNAAKKSNYAFLCAVFYINANVTST